MKTEKRILAAIMVCTAVALIYMTGTFTAAGHSGDVTNLQATMQLPEIVPAISIDLTIDRIFR
jgi:hypothetical protein